MEKQNKIAALEADRHKIYGTISNAPLFSKIEQEPQRKQPIYFVCFPLVISVLALLAALF